MTLSRRHALAAAGASALSLAIPPAAFGADTRGRKFVLIVLRGAMDGLDAVSAHNDPAYVAARKGLARGAEAGLPLADGFALHPRLATLHQLYLAKELTVVHAVGQAYRGRSHFEAQNTLEAGVSTPYGRDAGWLNLALGQLPSLGAERGVALSEDTPLVLRGPTPGISSWSPTRAAGADGETIARISDLYDQQAPQLAQLLNAALATNALIEPAMNDDPGEGMRQRQAQREAGSLAADAARFLAHPRGPAAATLDIGGWDTHAGQLAPGGGGPFDRAAGQLDSAMGALKAGLGPVWAQTVVLVVTEFGRTVAMNGSRGTDHGAATAAFLAGGAVSGGRVLADWPGLAPAQLVEGRDLRPTLDTRALIKAVLLDHLTVAQGALNQTVFPDSAAIRPLAGLMRG